MKKQIASILVVVICSLSVALPVSAQGSGLKDTFSVWSSSIGRSFRSVFAPPAEPTFSVPAPVTSPTITTSVPSTSMPSVTVNSASGLTADVLKKTLIAKTPAEEAYIDTIVAKRDAGRISAQTVSSAYRYAMKKNRDRRIVYFKSAIDALTGGS
ncbi:MAG: hypothetical protein ACRC46_08655 [Thermoguttaceae bacterium]